MFGRLKMFAPALGVLALAGASLPAAAANNPTTTVVVSPSTVQEGVPVNITVTSTTIGSGQNGPLANYPVQLVFNGTTISANTNAQGKLIRTFSYPSASLVLGANNASASTAATGSGNDRIAASAGQATFTVLPATTVSTTTSIVVSPQSIFMGATTPITLTATSLKTTGTPGPVPAGLNVDFYVDSTTPIGSATTNASGVATLVTSGETLLDGDHTIVAKLNDDDYVVDVDASASYSPTGSMIPNLRSRTTST
jgi:hypothetical protein